MSDDLIQFANDAFYAAFAAGDMKAMEGLWAEDAPLACVHPGHPPLFDRKKIIDSWRQILSDPGVGSMKMHSPRVVAASGTALVVCFENFGETTLAATNGFVFSGGLWRMTLHHAGMCNEVIPVPDITAPGRHVH